MDLNLTESDFKAWLKHCQPHLGNRTPDEIASLAHFVGFPWEIIFPTLSHFNDALRGSNYDNRMRMYWTCEIACIERLASPISLKERWMEVARKERGLDNDAL